MAHAINSRCTLAAAPSCWFEQFRGQLHPEGERTDGQPCIESVNEIENPQRQPEPVTAATEAEEHFAVSDLYDSAIVQAIVQRPRNGAVVVGDRAAAGDVRRGDSHDCGVVCSGGSCCGDSSNWLSISRHT
jgi:hypothetical protein